MPRSLLDGADLAGLRLAGLEGGPAALALACLLDGGAVQHDPDDPEWPDRDRVLVDPSLPLRALAGVLAGAGYPAGEGRLGQGAGRVMADAVAAAASSHAAGDVYRVYVVLAGPSLADGRVWEGLLDAGRRALAPLVALVLPGDGEGPPDREAALVAAGWWAERSAAAPAELLGALDRILDRRDGRPAALVVGPG